MAPIHPSEGVVELDASGRRYLAANDAALAILGVGIDELLASDPDRFAVDPADPEAQAEVAAQWEREGRDPVVGSASIRRADGRLVRVTYVVEVTETGYRARIRPVDAPVRDRPTMYTVGDVLREWREAERRLQTLTSGTPEWADVDAEIALLRSRYQEIFAGLQSRPADEPS